MAAGHKEKAAAVHTVEEGTVEEGTVAEGTVGGDTAAVVDIVGEGTAAAAGTALANTSVALGRYQRHLGPFYILSRKLYICSLFYRPKNIILGSNVAFFTALRYLSFYNGMNRSEIGMQPVNLLS
jgi:hypothetical protein